MGLKVWLPLNKNLKNVGLQNIKIENHGATFSTNNNEKCYYFNGSQQWVQFNQNIGNFYNNDFSVCFWINPTDDTRGIIISEYAGTGSSNVAIELRADRVLRLYWNGNPDKYFTTAGALTKNAWTHVAILKSGRVVKLYLNGELKETYTNSSDFPTQTSNCNPRIGDDYRGNTGSTVSFQGYLRDFRMYDHLLNEEDVKHIFQKKIFDLVPYSGVKNVLFDRSGFCVKRLINTNAKYYSNSISFSDKNQVIRSKGNGFEFSGGTLSAWFYLKTKPSSTQIFYIDGNNKMSCGLYNNATIFITSSNVSSPAYPADSVIYGSWNHVMITYGTNYVATNLYLNGVKITSNGTNYWTNGNTFLEIGGRAYYEQFFTGRTSCIRVYKDQLTQDDCLKLYNEERHMFLPDEYEELEYIQATGTQYIDAGVKACMNKIRCVCDMSPSNTADTAFFGSRGTYYLFYNVGNNYFWPTSKCETIQGTLAVGQKYHVDWNKGTLEVKGPNGVYEKGVRSNNTQDTTNMYIFNFNPTDSRSTSAKLYYFKIYIEDIIVRNFIPAKRKSDSVIGLYDMVSRQFFTNAGSGSFTGV